MSALSPRNAIMWLFHRKKKIAFAKSRKAPISFFISVCPQVPARLSPDGFSWNFILETVRKICREKPKFG